MASCFRIRTNESERTVRNEKDCTPKPVWKFGSLKCISASSLLLKVGKSSPRSGKWVPNDTYGTCRSEPDGHNSSLPTPTFWLMNRETTTKLTKLKHRRHKSSRIQVKDVGSDRRDENADNAVSTMSLNNRSVQCSSGSCPKSRDSNKESCITRLSTQSSSILQSKSTDSDDSSDSVFTSQNDLNQFSTHTSVWSNMSTDVYITPVQRTIPRCCPPTEEHVEERTDKDIKIQNELEGLNHTSERSFANIVNSPVLTQPLDSPVSPGHRSPEFSPDQESDLGQLDLAALGRRSPCLNSSCTVNDMNPDSVPPSHMQRGEEVRPLSRGFQDCPTHQVLDIPILPPRHKHFSVQQLPPRPCTTPYYVNFRGTLQSRNHWG